MQAAAGSLLGCPQHLVTTFLDYFQPPQASWSHWKPYRTFHRVAKAKSKFGAGEKYAKNHDFRWVSCPDDNSIQKSSCTHYNVSKGIKCDRAGLSLVLYTTSLMDVGWARTGGSPWNEKVHVVFSCDCRTEIDFHMDFIGRINFRVHTCTCKLLIPHTIVCIDFVLTE